MAASNRRAARKVPYIHMGSGLLLLLLAAISAGPPVALAQSFKPHEVFSSVSVSALAAPSPVLGADNRIHLAYELLVTHTDGVFVTLDKVEALGDDGRDVNALAGPALAAMIAPSGRGGTAIPPYGSALVFMDTSFPAGTRLPSFIAARVTIIRQSVGQDGKPAAYDADAPVPATITFTGPAIAVSSNSPVVVDPPLRGPRWIAMSGCCNELSSHRGAVMAVNGVQRIGQRFAIDWLQLRPNGRLYDGESSSLARYAYVGTLVFAVADGTIVNIYNDAQEQVPGSRPLFITPKDIGGNMLVIDIGGGHFAFFAHLLPNSLKVDPRLLRQARKGLYDAW